MVKNRVTSLQSVSISLIFPWFSLIFSLIQDGYWPILTWHLITNYTYVGLHIRFFLPSQIWRRAFYLPSPNSIYLCQTCKVQEITFRFLYMWYLYLLNVTNIYLRAWSKPIIDVPTSRPTMSCPWQTSLVRLCLSITFLSFGS